MSELVFLIEEAPEGGYTARALGESIFTEADDWDTLKRNIIDAVNCHYGNRSGTPKVIRLHCVKDEVLVL
ncbi:MAG: 2-oxoisovalerate dehydrogenase [Nitrospiria bacterium]